MEEKYTKDNFTSTMVKLLLHTKSKKEGGRRSRCVTEQKKKLYKASFYYVRLYMPDHTNIECWNQTNGKNEDELC